MMVTLEFKKGTNINWERSENWNGFYLTSSLEKIRNRFNNQGYIFLREILEVLAYPRITRYSITAGWKKGDSFDYGLVNVGTGFEIYLNVPHDDIRDIFED